MTSVLGVGALAMMAASRCPIEHGRMPLLAGPRHRPGGVLLYADDCLCLLLVVVLISSC
jgi:hypothetical protein